jgi:hypothetical protein
MSTEKRQSSLERLVDGEISNVSFIRDHARLSAHRSELICHTWPVVCVSGERFRLGAAQYRDKLCAFIGRSIRSVRELEREALTLVFDGGDTISVSLRQEDCRGVEAAMLQSLRGEVFAVWGCESVELIPRADPSAHRRGKAAMPAEEPESTLEYMIAVRFRRYASSWTMFRYVPRTRG